MSLHTARLRVVRGLGTVLASLTRKLPNALHVVAMPARCDDHYAVRESCVVAYCAR